MVGKAGAFTEGLDASRSGAGRAANRLAMRWGCRSAGSCHSRPATRRACDEEEEKKEKKEANKAAKRQRKTHAHKN